jgi:hypothetical protein
MDPLVIVDDVGVAIDQVLGHRHPGADPERLARGGLQLGKALELAHGAHPARRRRAASRGTCQIARERVP